MKKKTERILRIINRAMDIIFYPLLLFVILFSCFALFQKPNGNKPVSLLGYSPVKIMSNSMQASGFNTGDVVFIKKNGVTGLKKGDIIAFYSYMDPDNPAPDFGEDLGNANPINNQIWFHEITQIRNDSNGVIWFKTKGSSNKNEDVFWVRQDFVLGKYSKTGTFVSNSLKFLTTPSGIISCIFLPCGIILAFMCIQLINSISDAMYIKKIMSGQLSIPAACAINKRLVDNLDDSYKIFVYEKVAIEDREQYFTMLFSEVAKKSMEGKRLNKKEQKIYEIKNKYAFNPPVSSDRECQFDTDESVNLSTYVANQNWLGFNHKNPSLFNAKSRINIEEEDCETNDYVSVPIFANTELDEIQPAPVFFKSGNKDEITSSPFYWKNDEVTQQPVYVSSVENITLKMNSLVDASQTAGDENSKPLKKSKAGAKGDKPKHNLKTFIKPSKKNKTDANVNKSKTGMPVDDEFYQVNALTETELAEYNSKYPPLQVDDGGDLITTSDYDSDDFYQVKVLTDEELAEYDIKHSVFLFEKSSEDIQPDRAMRDKEENETNDLDIHNFADSIDEEDDEDESEYLFGKYTKY